MDVAHQFQEVLIGIDQNGLISSLEQVTGFTLLPVGPAGVAKGEVLHDSRQGYVRNLYQQMNVVGHETKRMDAMAITLSSLLHEEVEAVAVVFVEEDVLSGVAPQDHMVKGAGIMYSRSSCHG